MKFLGLILTSAIRSRRRTVLTVLSVGIAVFLFASLRAVLDGFNAGAEASSSTRIVAVRSTSLIFSMPTSHADVIRSTPGVTDLTWSSWFGGIYRGPQNFFAQFAVDAESYLRMYPEVRLDPDQRAAFLEDRTGCLVGDGLARRFDWSVDDRIVLQVGIPVYGTQDFTFTIRGIYEAASGAVDNQTMLFHWKYADERSLDPGMVGWYTIQVADPDQAAAVSSAIDGRFANTPYETTTETEKAFQSSFASMFGNLNVLLGSVALAVVITTLFVAGNTMAMSVRERTTEIAVMRTLGFKRAQIFGIVAGEGLLMSILGGIVGAGLARLLISSTLIPAAGFIPVFSVSTANLVNGVGLSVLIGLLAGLLPALRASRLKIVEALRRE